jgi:hypothetical protein
MKRPISKKEYVIGTFFVLAALLPLASADEGTMIDVLPPAAGVSMPLSIDALPAVIVLPVIEDASA